MSKTQSAANFSVGDAVRVKPGVTDPDFPDMPLGGWAGTISLVENSDPPAYLVELNEQTIESIHPVYLKRCERDDFESDRVWMLEEDLEPDVGDPVPVEQPTGIDTTPLSMDDQDDRIRSALGLTSDDPLPESDNVSLEAYSDYLAANLVFPFEAKYSIETGPFESKTFAITVLGVLDPDESPGGEYGVFCQASRGKERIELPLIEVEVRKGGPNRRLVEDYSYWFVNW